jgi:hypothetical protein
LNRDGHPLTAILHFMQAFSATKFFDQMLVHAITIDRQY